MSNKEGTVTLTRKECVILYEYFSRTYITKSEKRGVDPVFRKIAKLANDRSYEPDPRQRTIFEVLEP